MDSIRRRLLITGLAGLMVPARAVAKTPLPPKPAPQPTPAISPIGPVFTPARYAIVIDYNSGATLLDKNSDVPNPPSSMTKLMTIYLTFKELKEGRIRLYQRFRISAKAWHTGGSRMFLQVGSRVPVIDLIRGVFVDSGNDASVALAENIAGSERAFVHLMNAEAKRLGLSHSHFKNASGWPAPDHVMSVRDIAILAADIIRDFPEYYHFASEHVFTWNHIIQENRQPLVIKGIADGLKTGYTEEGGYGLVSSSERKGRRIILVLNGLPTWNSRIREGIRLTNWAFNSFRDVVLADPGKSLAEVPVWLGTTSSVPLVAARRVEVTLPADWKQRTRIAIDYTRPVPAPVRRGQVLGKLVVSRIRMKPISVPLVAGTNVARLGPLGRARAVLGHFVAGL